MVVPAGFEQRVFVVTTLTDPTNPSATEINAGTEITSEMPDPINFSGTTNYIDTSDISDRQDKNQVGNLSLDNITFEIYRPKTGAVAYPALDNETDYYIVKFEGGDLAGATPASGDTADVATVTVGIKTDVATPREDVRRVAVPLAIRDAISWRVSVAA